MLQEGGLGAQINQKADAYRSNPDALQKKAKLSGDLMDALALQKVMSDKAMAKQQLALSQQQDAGSVVEQMEQKLVGMNKEELTAQTAGIMGERNKQKQKQISAAAPPQKPPMQMAQGAPQGLPAAPRSPMQMAQGGIIGYDAGGLTEISDAQVVAFLKKKYGANLTGAQLKLMLNDPKRIASEKQSMMKDAARDRAGEEITRTDRTGIRDRQARQKELLGLPTVAREKMSEDTEAQLGTLSGIMSEAKPKPKPTPFSAVPPQDGIANIAGQSPAVGVPVDPNAPPVGVPVDPNAPAVGVPADPNAVVPPKLDNAPDLSGVREAALSDRLKPELEISKGIASVNMGEEKQKELSRLSGPAREEIMGPDGKPTGKFKELGGFNRKSYDDQSLALRKEKDALEKELLDPSKVKKAKYNKWMEAVQGGGLKAGRGALNKFDTDRAASRQASISEQKAMYKEDMKFDEEIADKIGTQAIKVFEVYADDVSKAMDTAATVGIANLDMFYKEAKMAYDSNQDGIKNKIDAIKTSTAANLQELIQSQATMQEISSAAINLTAEIGKLKENFYSTLAAEKLGIESELNKKETTPARRKQLLAQLDEYELRFAAQKEILEADAFMQILKTMMEESGRNNGFSSKTKQQVQQIVKTSTGTSQQQTTGLANARQQAILKKQATTKYVPTD